MGKTKYFAITTSGIILWRGPAESPAEAIRALSEDMYNAGDHETVEIEETIYQMLQSLADDDDRAIGIIEQYKLGRVEHAALRAAIEAVEENNRLNSASWSDWEDSWHICAVYDIENLGFLEHAILNRAIESRGESLTTDLPMIERLVWGMNFAGSWWNRDA